MASEYIKRIVHSTLGSAGIGVGADDLFDIRVRGDAFYDALVRRGLAGVLDAYVDGLWETERLDELTRRFLKSHLPSLAESRPQLLWRAMVPMHRFESVLHYYESTTAKPWLRAIRVPTRMVHAEDDPVIPGATVAATLRDLPSCVDVAWTRRGGHIGWFTGPREDAWIHSWAMRSVLAFFESHRGA